MSGEKRDTLLVMSVALAVTLAGIFGGVLFLGMEKARPGEGFHYTFDPARARLKASSYFAYLEKEGSPAAARAAGLARKLLPFLGPAPRAAEAGRGTGTSYRRPPGPPAPASGYGEKKGGEDHPDWDSVYDPPFAPASRRPGYSPGYGGGYGVSRTASSPRGLNDSSEPPDVKTAARREAGQPPRPAPAPATQETARAATAPGARQTAAGGEKQYVPAGYGDRGAARVPGVNSGNARPQVPGGGPLSGGMEAMSARSARSYTAKVSGGVGGGQSAGMSVPSSGSVPKVSGVSATSARPYSAVSGVMTSVVTDKLNGRENPAVNQAEAAKTPPATLTKPGGVTTSATTAASTSTSASGPQPAQQASSPQTTAPGEDPEDPARLPAARVKELQGEIETSLRQIENAYGPMADMYYKSCDNSALCAEHGLKGGYVTMTTTLDARIELGLKYVQKKWERYTISFDPGRAFDAKDDGEEGQ